ncbi:putative Cyclin fold protein [Blattamonas nauphoetae]|uniref:Cyclin fold protein n=1 Tax=Blattamonas nauphoetae TaxID=2049346 RepID=A0ABQ9XYL9_9EUKA|nr:putative Cyclin fold protein [Blattamonas nauphoetae]
MPPTQPAQPPACGVQLNRTVEGVSAAILGLLYSGSNSLSSFTAFHPSFSVFNNPKLIKTVKDNRKENSTLTFDEKAKLNPPITAHSQHPVPPFMTVYKHVYSLFRRAQVEPECLIASISYLSTLLSHCSPNSSSPLALTSLNWERLTFTLIMIASKAWDDVSCSSKSFATCSNGEISLAELGRMERLVLTVLDYTLYLTADDYRVLYYNLKKFWMNLVVDAKGHITPSPLNVVKELGIPEDWCPHLVFLCPTIPNDVSPPYASKIASIAPVPVLEAAGVSSQESHDNIARRHNH